MKYNNDHVDIVFNSSYDEEIAGNGRLRRDNPRNPKPKVIENRKLDSIEVRVDGNLVRKYVFTYATSSCRPSNDYGGIDYSGNHTLTSITEYGADGASSLPAMCFTYADLQTRLHDTDEQDYSGNPGNPAEFYWPHLTGVTNGYGATITYEYTQKPSAAAVNIWTREVVTTMTTNPGIGPAVTTQYTYFGDPNYRKPNWLHECEPRQSIHTHEWTPDPNYRKPNWLHEWQDEYRGFGQVRATDSEGNYTDHYFHTDGTPIAARAPGKEYKTEWFNTSGQLLERKEFTWEYETIAQSPVEGMVARWPFDEGWGSFAHDTQGSNNGQIFGAQWTADAVAGKALLFDGQDDYVDCGNGSALQITGDISVSLWFKTSAAEKFFISKNDGYWAQGAAFEGHTGAPGMGPYFTVRRSTSPYYLITYSPTDIKDGKWHHFAGIRQGSTVQIYVDGTLHATGTDPTLYMHTQKPLKIGKRDNAEANFFAGAIDEVRIYDRALSAAEVSDLFHYPEAVGEPTHFVYLSEVTDTQGSKVSRTRYEYDDYGNVIAEYRDGDISISEDDVVIRKVFYPNTAANILSKPAEERTYDYLNNLKSQTLYYYDGNNTSVSIPPTAGNLTRIEKFADAGTSVSIYFTYDSYGNVLTETDANGNVWTTTYDSTYHTFPATISAPISGMTESYTFDPKTGNLLSRTDVNGQTTSYEYDTFGRLTKVIRPGDSSQSPSSQYEYNNWGTLGQQHLKSLAKVAEGDYLWSAQYFDGLGRVIQTQSRGETESRIIIPSTAEYDGRGFLAKEYVAQSGSPTGVSYHEMSVYAASDGCIQSVGSPYPSVQNAEWGAVYMFPSAWVSNQVYAASAYSVSRGFFRFDTSGLPDTCTIVSAKLSIQIEELSCADAEQSDVLIYAGTQGNSLEGQDFRAFNGVLLTQDPSFDVSPVSTGQLTSSEFNTTGLTTINKGGHTYLCLRMRGDVSVSQPEGENFLQWNSSSRPDGNDPKLVIGYWDQTAGPSHIPPESSWKYASYTYDALGRVTSTTAADGTTTSTDYSVPWQTTVTNERGYKHRYYYDAFGRLVKVEELDASHAVYATTTYAYDTLGNLVQVTDDHGNITTMNYDWLGRKTSMTDPDMGTWSYTYDANGNLIAQTDAKGQTITLSYDAMNRLTGKAYPPGSGMPNITYAYDSTAGGNFGKGRRTGMTDAFGTTSYKYDARGRLVEEKRTLWGVDYTTGFAYDAADRLATVTYPTGETVTQTYNNRGFPETLAGSATGNLVTGVEYNQLGQITRISLGNGAETIFGYWDMGGPNDHPGGYYGRLYQIKTVKDSSSLQHLIHVWDAAGNLVVRADIAGGEGEMFQYDFLDRLTSVSGACTQTYAYDTIGNITAMNGQSYTYGSKPHAVTAAGATTYEYDANGNMTRRGSQTLTWNVENQLINVNSGSNTAFMAYDGDGNRFFKYEWSNGSAEVILYVNQYFEKNLSTSEVITHYFLGGKEIAFKKGSALEYLHTDHLGSTSLTTDTSGTTVSTVRYFPFGAVRAQTGIPGTDKRFTGRRLDRTGLHHYNARYYDATIGRFISPDTIVPKPTNPQSLNRYSYCLNNPLRWADPSGRGASRTPRKWCKKPIVEPIKQSAVDTANTAKSLRRPASQETVAEKEPSPQPFAEPSS